MLFELNPFSESCVCWTDNVWKDFFDVLQVPFVHFTVHSFKSSTGQFDSSILVIILVLNLLNRYCHNIEIREFS